MALEDPLNKRERRHIRDNDPVLSNRPWGVDLPLILAQMMEAVQAEIDNLHPVEAFEVNYDDSVTLLGVNNVQDAIEALHALVIQGVQCVRVPFTFATASPLVLTVLATGDMIDKTTVCVTTAFDDVSAGALVGSVSTPGLIFDTNEVKLKKLGQFDSEAIITAVGATTVQLTLTPGLSTVGAGFVLLKLKKV